MRTKIAIALLAAFLIAPSARAGDDRMSAAEAKAQLTEQLVEILSKTRSTDTFVVTLGLLVESKADPRVIPAVIASAERLGIFDDHLTDDSPKSKLAEGVRELIQMIQKPGNKPTRSCSPFGPADNSRLRENAPWVPTPPSGNTSSTPSLGGNTLPGTTGGLPPSAPPQRPSDSVPTPPTSPFSFYLGRFH
jgi:hypothetical protein